MRTSTAWLLATALVLLAALATYDAALHQAYQRQRQDIGSDDYATLDLQDFTEVVLPDSGSLGVKITQGPFRVQVRGQYARVLHVRRQGRQLIVQADSSDAMDDEELLRISCPRLAKVSTRPSPPLAAPSYYEGHCHVTIEGFRADSLALYQARLSHISLTDTHLRHLQATVGRSPSSTAYLELSRDNRIGAADLAVNGHSKLSVDEFIIPKLRYQFADSSIVQLPGAMLPRQRPPGRAK